MLLLAIVICGFYVTMTLIPPNDEHYFYVQHNKMARLDTLSSPRLIFVGGSNLAFGLNSGLIADSLHINVQNTALHAGIGLRFMLDEVLERSKKGDLVVIMPEYPLFTQTYYGDDTGSLTAAVDYSGPKAWKKLNLKQFKNVISGFRTHLRGKFTKTHSDKWSYSARNFNEWGDESAHWNVPAPGLGNGSLSETAEIEDDAVSDFASKLRELHARGCKVLLFWPVTIRSYFKKNEVVIGLIEKALNEQGIAFDCVPDYFVQPDSLVFDTPYHMSKPAVDDDTQRMLQILKQKGVARSRLQVSVSCSPKGR